MNWEEVYQKGDAFWNKGGPSPPMKQYLERNAVRGRTLVPGCGHGHEVVLAVAHGLDATGLDIAPTGVAAARALYPQLAERFVAGDLFNPPVQMHGAYDEEILIVPPHGGVRVSGQPFGCKLRTKAVRLRA